MHNIKSQFYKSIVIFLSFIFFLIFFVFLNFKYSKNVNATIYAKKEVITYKFFDKKENDLSFLYTKQNKLLTEDLLISVDYKNQFLIIPKYSKIVDFQTVKIKNKFLHLILVEHYNFLNHTIIIDDIKNLPNIKDKASIDILFYKLKISKFAKINQIDIKDKKIKIDINFNDEVMIDKAEIIIKL